MRGPPSRWTVLVVLFVVLVVADQWTKFLAVERLTFVFDRAGDVTLGERIRGFYGHRNLESLATPIVVTAGTAATRRWKSSRARKRTVTLDAAVTVGKALASAASPPMAVPEPTLVAEQSLEVVLVPALDAKVLHAGFVWSPKLYSWPADIEPRSISLQFCDDGNGKWPLI